MREHEKVKNTLAQHRSAIMSVVLIILLAPITNAINVSRKALVFGIAK